MVAVDTTVISYFAIEGEHTEDALAVRREDAEWCAPPLWRSEFANVLWMYVREGEFGYGRALELLELATDLIGERTLAVVMPEVLRLAVDSGCTAYDCQYVALARAEDMPLVTNDQEILDAFPETAVTPGDFVSA